MATGTLKLISLFSGYDSPLMALDNLNVDYDLLYWSEIDPYAIQAHNIAHPAYQHLNIGDISTATPPCTKADILFYSSPCQDFSKAGHNKGGAEGSGTRSALLWHVQQHIQAASPSILIMENVPTLATTHANTLHKWLNRLLKLGYYSTSIILNCADTGTPQNRKRLFVVSTKSDLPLLALPTILPNNFTRYLDAHQVADHLYIDTRKIPNLHLSPNTNFPKLLGYSRNYDNPQNSNYHEKHLYNTITCKNVFPPCNLIAESETRIRRLSHTERLRIQGVPEDTIKKLDAKISETQLNKLAGNSIPTTMLELLIQSIIINF